MVVFLVEVAREARPGPSRLAPVPPGSTGTSDATLSAPRNLPSLSRGQPRRPSEPLPPHPARLPCARWTGPGTTRPMPGQTLLGQHRLGFHQVGDLGHPPADEEDVGQFD